ncbi:MULTISPECIES: DUF2970 domain-containing protein [Pseudoduganella]
MKSFLYSMKAVLWSFVGLRRKGDFDQDEQKLSIFHVILAALLGAALFIGLLVSIVKLVVPK